MLWEKNVTEKVNFVVKRRAATKTKSFLRIKKKTKHKRIKKHFVCQNTTNFFFNDNKHKVNESNGSDSRKKRHRNITQESFNCLIANYFIVVQPFRIGSACFFISLSLSFVFEFFYSFAFIGRDRSYLTFKIRVFFCECVLFQWLIHQKGGWLVMAWSNIHQTVHFQLIFTRFAFIREFWILYPNSVRK